MLLRVYDLHTVLPTGLHTALDLHTVLYTGIRTVLTTATHLTTAFTQSPPFSTAPTVGRLHDKRLAVLPLNLSFVAAQQADSATPIFIKRTKKNSFFSGRGGRGFGLRSSTAAMNQLNR